MKSYHVKTLHHSRVIASVFLISVILILSIIVAAECNGIVAILFAILLVYFTYYYCKGNLTVTLTDDNQLLFKYEKKYFFNLKNPSEVYIRDIIYLVVDNNDVLRKIVTKNRAIVVNNIRFKEDDAQFLQRDCLVKTIDSWDYFNKKDYANLAYKLNYVIIGISLITIIVYTYFKGFHASFLSVFILIIPQLILYGKQLKKKF
jgi:hypothetical protein